VIKESMTVFYQKAKKYLLLAVQLNDSNLEARRNLIPNSL
jgi:hypothetical protein